MVVPVGYTEGALESPIDIKPTTIVTPPTITEHLFAWLPVIVIPLSTFARCILLNTHVAALAARSRAMVDSAGDDAADCGAVAAFRGPQPGNQVRQLGR